MNTTLNLLSVSKYSSSASIARPHNVVCRNRIEAEMMKDPEGMRRITEARQRQVSNAPEDLGAGAPLIRGFGGGAIGPTSGLFVGL